MRASLDHSNPSFWLAPRLRLCARRRSRGGARAGLFLCILPSDQRRDHISLAPRAERGLEEKQALFCNGLKEAFFL